MTDEGPDEGRQGTLGASATLPVTPPSARTPAPKPRFARRSNIVCLARVNRAENVPSFWPKLAATSVHARPSIQHSTNANRCDSGSFCTSSAIAANAASHVESATGRLASGCALAFSRFALRVFARCAFLHTRNATPWSPITVAGVV